MLVKHAQTSKEVELKPGAIVGATGMTKSVSIGKVVDVVQSQRVPGTEEAIVFWYGVGCGSGWMAHDLIVYQTPEEHATILRVGARRFLKALPETRVAELHNDGFTATERSSIGAIAREMRVRHIDLMRMVREEMVLLRITDGAKS